MDENDKQNRGMNDEERSLVEEGPTEKLRNNSQPGAKIPGAQNPESEEVKKEINPNTE